MQVCGGAWGLTHRRLGFELGQMKAPKDGEAVHTDHGCQRPHKESRSELELCRKKPPKKS